MIKEEVLIKSQNETVKKQKIMLEKEKNKEIRKKQQALFNRYFALKKLEKTVENDPEKHKQVLDSIQDLEYTIIDSNVNLIKKIAFKRQPDSLESEDVIQEGKTAMLEALRRYDPSKKIKFGTFAYRWIDGKIQNYIRDNGRMIHVHWVAFDNYKTYKKAQYDFREEKHINPTEKQIIELLNSNNETLYIPGCDRKIKSLWTIDRIKIMRMIDAQTDLSSINETLDNDSDSELFEVIEDKTIPTPDDIVFGTYEDETVNNKVEDLFVKYVESGLEQRKLDILRLRYGSYDNRLTELICETIKRVGRDKFGTVSEKGLTLQQVAYVFNIVRESVRIEENTALRHLQFLAGDPASVEIKEGYSFRFLRKDLQLTKRKKKRPIIEYKDYDKDIISIDPKAKIIYGLKQGNTKLSVIDKTNNATLTYNISITPNENKKCKKLTLGKED